MNKYIVRIYLGGFFMEYAKDIILELNKGQALQGENYKNKTRIEKFFGKIFEHKIMATIISLTIGFMICDIMLISSFVDILVKI